MSKHIHIVGICGTFMGGVAVLAKSLGYTVTGSDANVYPPMSTQLESLGIDLKEGFSAGNLETNTGAEPDMVVIGNALSRGNIEVEAVLNRGLPYTSGAQWLADNVLQDKWVLAVSGTHGKTTTASMLAWILDYAQMPAGFLVGGVLQNFGVSARLGEVPFFVIEADEYDTAFFDKRSKFVHYRPRTLLINNLEFDHADIFDDLSDIQTQFHNLVRTVPGNGLIVYPDSDETVATTLRDWTATETIGGTWQHHLLEKDGSAFEVLVDGELQGEVHWDLIGEHNVQNAMGAIACARHAGVPTKYAIQALKTFQTPKRRMELKGEVAGIKVYDDFAHHPTAIETTLAGLRAKVGDEKIVAILEPRSNTMKMGVHKDKLRDSLEAADEVMLYQTGEMDWSLADAMQGAKNKVSVFEDTTALLDSLHLAPQDHVLIMSNGGFENIHARLLDKLKQENEIGV